MQNYIFSAINLVAIVKGSLCNPLTTFEAGALDRERRWLEKKRVAKSRYGMKK